MASKKSINILPFIIVAAFGVVLYLLWKKGIFSKVFGGNKPPVDNTTYKESESNVPKPSSGSSSGSTSNTGTTLNRSLVLSNGMFDYPEVGHIQREMNKYAKKKGWKPLLDVDNDFGDKTEKMLIRISGQPSINIKSLEPYLNL